MVFALFPFKYYAVLPDSTLTTKIREESWKLDKLFPLLKESKKELNRLRKSVKANQGDVLKLQHAIAKLAACIIAGIHDLKLINFYDSAILYLYFRLLRQVLDLCKKEKAKLEEEKRQALSKKIKFKGKKLEDIKKAKEDIEKKVKEHEEIMHGLALGENELINASAKLLNELRKLRWKAEKQAQDEFSFSKITLRSLENLNRKIKTEALKVKKIVPREKEFISRIRRKHIPKDVASLAKLISEAIGRISKDVYYSSKLISKFEKEIKKLKSIVENLKKTLNKLVKERKITEETAKKIFEPWDNTINYIEKEIHKYLMRIFRNIFVLYKHVGTRQPKAA